MNKILKIIGVILLGGVVISIGNTIPSVFGSLIVIVGGVGTIYGIVNICKKKKLQK